MKIIRTDSMLKWLWLTLLLVVLDQVSKQWLNTVLTPYEEVPLFPHLNFYLAFNEGMAFSILSTAGGWQRWFLAIVALVASGLLVYWIRSLKQHEALIAASLACILSGALGNVIDRILFGHVIDFIQFYYRADSCLWGFTAFPLGATSQCIWPSFNIADSAITIGATLLILDGIRGLRRNARNKTSDAKSV